MTTNIQKKAHTACFTGPRPNKLAGYIPQHYEKLSNFLLDYVGYLSAHGPMIDTFITGGAQGFDILAHDVIEDLLKIPSTAPIVNKIIAPFPGYDAKWAPDGLFGKNRNSERLQSAALTNNLSYTGTTYSKDIYLKRNDQMLEESSTLIALWPEGNDDWESPSTTGGTAYTMRKAKKMGLTIRIIRYRIDEIYGVIPVRADVIGRQ